MITVTQDSIFELNADIIVVATNTQGVAGCGTALEFKNRYPAAHALYVEACKNKTLLLGIPYIIKNPDLHKHNISPQPRYLVCLSTKIKPSRYETTKLTTVSNGLDLLAEKCHTFFSSQDTIAIPLLGCGAGKLKPEVVSKLIQAKFSEVPQTVYVSEY